MKRETIVAIILGIAAGIGIGLFVIIQSREVASENDVILDELSPTTTIKTEEIDPLLIKSPEDESVTTSDTITLTASSTKNSLVVIQSLSEEIVFTNEDGGEFKREITLIPGENDIRVTAYSDNSVDSRTLTIFNIVE